MSRKKTTIEFINESKKIHGNNVIYDNVEYINSTTKVCLICPKHGKFWQKPNNHLMGQGCPLCFGKHRKTINEFKEEIYNLYGNNYDLSKVEDYVNNRTKVCVICHKKDKNGIEHGEFNIRPDDLLHNHGCPKCANEIKKIKASERSEKSKNNFFKNVKSIHNNYDFSKFKYTSALSKSIVICPAHGEFLAKPSSLLQKHGCPKCNKSKLEIEISQFLKSNNIKFIEQYNCPWLGLQSLDFYLPDYNIGIECQGKQHFLEGCTFGGNETLDTITERDKRKLEKCQTNGVKLLYYSNLGIEYPYQVFEDKETLLNEIISKHI